MKINALRIDIYEKGLLQPRKSRSCLKLQFNNSSAALRDVYVHF